MSKIISFTGASHSGKTTAMQHTIERLKSQGYNPIMLKEPIRDLVKDKSIDEIRSDPKAYVDLQCKIFEIRSKQLQDAYEDKDRNNIYLEDRAMTDSIFYINCYIDKTKLDKETAEKYVALYLKICDQTKYTFWPHYTGVIEFLPINASENTDKMRPENMSVMSDYEFHNINLLNTYYDKFHHILEYTDVNNYNYKGLDKIIDKLVIN